MRWERRETGTVLIEGLAVTATLTVLFVGLFLATYLLLARLWIHYASEQALYCLAETARPRRCEDLFRRRLEKLLPWGEIRRIHLYSRSGEWNVETHWFCQGYLIRVKRRLSVNLVVKNRVLPW